MAGMINFRAEARYSLSEPAFVEDVEDPVAGERRFNIFTPQDEIPFAGHPAIGTAACLQPCGANTLLVKAEPV